MKAKDLVELGEEELEQRLRAAREELFNLRFQHATGQLENTSRLSEIRRDIARLLTIQNGLRKAEES